MIFMQTNGRGPLLVLRRSLRWHWLHRLPLHLLHRYCVLSKRPNHPHAGLPIQGARSKPLAEVGSTSLMCGPAAELGRPNGINSTGSPRCFVGNAASTAGYTLRHSRGSPPTKATNAGRDGPYNDGDVLASVCCGPCCVCCGVVARQSGSGGLCPTCCPDRIPVMHV